MKILFVFEGANLYTNGTAATCLRSARELEKRGHTVTLMGCEAAADYPYEHYVGLKLFHFPVFQKLITKEGFNFVKIDDKTIYETIKKCDIVHIFLPFKLGSHCRLIAEGLGKPVTCAFHLLPQNITSAIHIGWWKGINDILFYSFRKYCYDYINICHCPTEMTSYEMKKHKYKNDCHVVSNGVNLDFFSPKVVEKPEKLRDKFVIVSVGRLAEEKRQDLIIKAIAESKHKNKIHLILCGQGPKKMTYQALAMLKGVEMEVKFCTQEELRDVLAYSDLYVHCADFEIEGISCIEAFAMGLVPLIGDARMSATRFFALNDNCLYRHGNKKDLAKKVDWFIEHPEEKREYSEKYVQKAQEYALPHEVDKMEEMFFKALKEKEAGEDYFSKFGNRKKDMRKMYRIFNKLRKAGVVEEIPPAVRKKPRD